MKGMVGEKGILPERSEWFRSRAFTSTFPTLISLALRLHRLSSYQPECRTRHVECHDQGLLCVFGAVLSPQQPSRLLAEPACREHVTLEVEDSSFSSRGR
jgi:hypothetical protein